MRFLLFFLAPGPPKERRRGLACIFPNVRDSGCDAVGRPTRCPAMRAGCALTALLALGLVAFVASAGPRRPHNRPFAKAAQHEQLVWTEGACRRPQPRVLCLKALRPNDTRVSQRRAQPGPPTGTTLRELAAWRPVGGWGIASGILIDAQ